MRQQRLTNWDLRYKKPTKKNQGLPRIGMMVAVDDLPELGVDQITNIDYDNVTAGICYGEIMVKLKGFKDWAYWNNCTEIKET